jgi:hypothetical protein
MNEAAEDVMAEYKAGRFVVADPILGFGTRLIVLSDFTFWIDRLEALETWCQLHGAVRKGTTVEIPTDEVLTVFILQWS